MYLKHYRDFMSAQTIACEGEEKLPRDFVGISAAVYILSPI